MLSCFIDVAYLIAHCKVLCLFTKRVRHLYSCKYPLVSYYCCVMVSLLLLDLVIVSIIHFRDVFNGANLALDIIHLPDIIIY